MPLKNIQMESLIIFNLQKKRGKPPPTRTLWYRIKNASRAR